MSKQVWKYVVPVRDELVTKELPVGATIVAVDSQFGNPEEVTFWAEFDNPFAKEERLFQVFGTGHAIPDQFKYVGTAKTADGALIWHLYEALEY